MIRIPPPINPDINFRLFVEYIVDHSVQFRTASGLAKAALLLGADLDTVDAVVEPPAPALKLIREALADEENPVPLPPLMFKDTGKPVPNRIWRPYIVALSNDLPAPIEEAAPAPTEEAAPAPTEAD